MEFAKGHPAAWESGRASWGRGMPSSKSHRRVLSRRKPANKIYNLAPLPPQSRRSVGRPGALVPIRKGDPRACMDSGGAWERAQRARGLPGWSGQHTMGWGTLREDTRTPLQPLSVCTRGKEAGQQNPIELSSNPASLLGRI